jgi:hypothetical protein
VELRYLPNAEDWENANRSLPKKWRAWDTFQFAISFVPLFFIGAGLVGSGNTVAGFLCMGLSIAIALGAYEVPKARRRRQFRNSPLTDGERILRVNENGVAADFPNATVQYGWQAFTRYRETDLSFLLFSSADQIGVWIPKRVMSPLQIEELRHILKARLPMP